MSKPNYGRVTSRLLDAIAALNESATDAVSRADELAAVHSASASGSAWMLSGMGLPRFAGTRSAELPAALEVDGTLSNALARLKAALAEQRPEPGDTITITMTEIEKRSGGKTLKHFDVTVDRGSKPATKPATKPAPAPAAAAAAPAASGYTAEQIEAMKILGIEPPA